MKKNTWSVVAGLLCVALVIALVSVAVPELQAAAAALQNGCSGIVC